MLGIEEIASYLPQKKVSNYDLKEKFDIDDNFIENKIGVKYRTLKEKDEKVSDLCVKAHQNLKDKIDIKEEEIDCCIVVTQNPDFNIPHTSAIVHKKLGLSKKCACFDISLGCSGYVYGLSSIISFMQFNNLKKGLLFTADPYSDIIDKEDKNTVLLFGDGASVTLISENAKYAPKSFSFGTDGNGFEEIICENNKLYMNGRGVFNFTATVIPKHIKEFLEKNDVPIENIDKYILHQGSKYIVDTIKKRLKLDEKKVPFDMQEYGNTVSSAVAIILEKEIKQNYSKILVTVFGIGLSWGSVILEKKGDK
jgi:3-oxoacyl-[acyl-carrier-protein] synthase-3